MEQLQPLIKHRFWVLTGLIVVLSFVGWIMGSKQLEEETQSQITKIEGATTALPDVNAAHPNKDWTGKLVVVNDRREDQSDEKADELHKDQVALMIWPPSIAKHFEGACYREPGSDCPGQKKEIALDIYRDGYRRDVIAPLVRMVKPYDSSKKIGIVKFQASTMSYFPEWNNKYSPTWDEMWDVQEDYWLTRSLLGAINKVNVNANDYYDANINEIGKLNLVAGSEPKLVGYKGKSGGAGGGTGQKPPRHNLSGAGTGGGTMQKSGNRSGSNTKKSGEFIPIDDSTKIDEIMVFGDPVKTGVDQTKTPDSRKIAKAVAEQNAQNFPNPRYVENGESYPFKTRGFVLSLNMKSEALPQLLIELNQLAWPVEIKRVHWKLRNPDLHGDLEDRLIMNTKDQKRGPDRARQKKRQGGDSGEAKSVQLNDATGRQRRGGSAGKSSARKENGQRTTVKRRPDRRSDIQVEIAGVLTIYQPSEKSKITLSSVERKKNVNPKPKTKSETKDNSTGPISKTKN